MPHRAAFPGGPTIPATGARPRESPGGFPVRSHRGGMRSAGTGPATVPGHNNRRMPHRAASPGGPTIPATVARPRESPGGFPVRSHRGSMRSAGTGPGNCARPTIGECPIALCLPTDLRFPPPGHARGSMRSAGTGPATVPGHNNRRMPHRAVSPDGPTIPATGAGPRESPGGFPVRSHRGGMPGATGLAPARACTAPVFGPHPVIILF